jgi:hypothetical protein
MLQAKVLVLMSLLMIWMMLRRRELKLLVLPIELRYWSNLLDLLRQRLCPPTTKRKVLGPIVIVPW